MQRHLTAEDTAVRDEVRAYVRTHVPQDVRDKVRAGAHLERDDIVRAHRALHEGGYAVPHWPQRWGGQPWTELQRHLWHEELQAASVPIPLAFNASMVGPVIAQFGSPQLQERFLPPTASLDIWWCQGFSEPGAGSDLASLTTRAVRDGDHYVVNGQKTWTTLAQWADWIFALVRTDPAAPRKQQGISFLLIDMSTPGVEVRPIELVDGVAEVNEVWFTDVRVPVDQLVGEENRGWDIAKFLLGNERVGVAPVGTIKQWLAQAKEYAAQLAHGDGHLIDDPALALRIAALEAEVMALELTVLRVAGGSRDGRPDPASSILKLRGSQLQQDVLELVLDLAGPMALRWDVLTDTLVPDWATRAAGRHLNFRKASIYGGSNEVQRQIIATGILGLKA